MLTRSPAPFATRPTIHIFSPLPPAATAIADHTAQIIPALAERCDLTLWTDQAHWSDFPGIRIRRFSAADLPLAELSRADVVFYNLGNNLPFHNAVFEVSRRVDGIVILHDSNLQQFFLARAAIQPRWRDEYLAAMHRHHGDAAREAGEQKLAGQPVPIDILQRYPLTAAAIEGRRAVVTHNPAEAAVLGRSADAVFHVPLAYDVDRLPALRPRRHRGAHRLIIAGHLGHNRGLAETLQALATPALSQRYQLDVFGTMEPGSMQQFDMMVDRLGLHGRVRRHGFVAAEVLDAALSRADLAINLRTPTMGEASSSQLMYWAQALPSVVSRCGWYATLPKETVSFVEPGDEIAGLRRILRAYDADRAPFVAAGRRGRSHLVAVHGATAYAEALLQIAAATCRSAPEPPAVEPAVTRLADEPPPDEAPAIYGYIDSREGGELCGWAHVIGEPEARVTIALQIDGVTATETEASLFRDDVRDAGHGDGCYGFLLPLPQGTDATHAVRVVACWGDQKLVLLDTAPHTARIRLGSTPLVGNRPWRTLHVELGDLMRFMAEYRHVSGIQRAQLGYLANLLDAPSISFCAYATERNEFITVERAELSWMLRSCLGEGDVDYAVRRQRLVHMLTFDKRPAMRMADGDVLLVTGAYWIHPGWFRAIQRLQQQTGIRYVQIVYDAIPICAPESMPPSEIVRFARGFAAMMRSVDAILVISHAAASDLRRLAGELQLPVPPVGLITLGGIVCYMEQDVVPEADAPLPAGLSDFVLCVGTVEPRKNHVYLYRIWQRMLESPLQPVPKLVIVGRMGWNSEELQRHLDATDSLDGHIVLLPDVTDIELRTLYRRCRFTVFVSTYEGWGLPVSESLAAGKLCVASRNTSIPEAGGDWAIYVDPYNVDDGARTIAALIADPELVRQREAEIARSYRPLTWPEATQGLLSEMARLLHELPPRAIRHTELPNLVTGLTYLPPSEPGRTSPVTRVRTELQRLEFGRMLCGEDWHDIEDWGVWARGPVARLAFGLADRETTTVCYLRLVLPRWLGRQRGEIVVDGRIADEPYLDDTPRTLSFRIEPRADGRHQVEIRLPGFAPPPADDPESRIIGVGLVHLHLCGENDVAARLQYIERSLPADPRA